MQTGIGNLSIVPLRATDSHRSEMVSEVLFAEPFEIIEENKEWARVRMIEVDYEGWLQQGQFERLSPDQYDSLFSDGTSPIDLSGGIAYWEDKPVELLPGGKIPHLLLRESAGAFPCRIKANIRVAVQTDFQQEWPKLMAYYQNSPYLWGGRTRYGIDCSGLSQAIYAHFGVALPRDAYQQAEGGRVVDDLSTIQPGDLAFFENESGRITHVGIMMDAQTIFHASAYVRSDRMDARGILHQGHYTHKLSFVKRFLTTAS